MMELLEITQIYGIYVKSKVQNLGGDLFNPPLIPVCRFKGELNVPSECTLDCLMFQDDLFQIFFTNLSRHDS